ncbi:hypothetical protein [uncultured Microbulbifer sp.]|uniref:hypothetical protein n=1 Tax=uncultured Microbulbifer sp. TaxID=348147 RepID=UPI0026058D47|nr:hypothetical protein [uncultured Microbulbifer sp.]
MCALDIHITLFPEMADKVRAWVRRRKELEMLGELGKLSLREAQERRQIDFQLARFTSAMMQLVEPVQPTLH